MGRIRSLRGVAWARRRQPARSRIRRGTAIVVLNVAGTDPHGMLRAHGEQVLPELRGEAG